MMMIREEARTLWANSGQSYSALSWPNIERLESILAEELEASGLMRGTYRINRKKTKIRKPPHFSAELKCMSHYFDDREAVTFNPNGFIGFAGWADEENIQPILRGFSRWVNELSDSRHRATERV